MTYRLHYASADRQGDDSPWSVYSEEYASLEDNEPLPDTTKRLSTWPTGAKADAEANRLQTLVKLAHYQALNDAEPPNPNLSYGEAADIQEMFEQLDPATLRDLPENAGISDMLEELVDAFSKRPCHCGAPAQGPPSDYPDVCNQWPLCEQRANADTEPGEPQTSEPDRLTITVDWHRTDEFRSEVEVDRAAWQAADYEGRRHLLSEATGELEDIERDHMQSSGNVVDGWD